MKKMISLRSLLSLVLVCCVGFVMARDNQDEVDALYKKLQSEKVMVDIYRVSTATMPNNQRFNPQGTLTFTDTLSVANLPYFGVMYNAPLNPYGSEGGGIDFKEKPTDVEWKVKKSRVELEYEVNTTMESFDVNITFYPNMRCYMTISGSDREVVTYDGNFEFPKPKKK